MYTIVLFPLHIGTLKLADKKSIYLPSTIWLVIETDQSHGADISSVHMTAGDIGWEAIIDKWLHSSGAELVKGRHDKLKNLFVKLVLLTMLLDRTLCIPHIIIHYIHSYCASSSLWYAVHSRCYHMIQSFNFGEFNLTRNLVDNILANAFVILHSLY